MESSFSYDLASFLNETIGMLTAYSIYVVVVVVGAVFFEYRTVPAPNPYGVFMADLLMVPVAIIAVSASGFIVMWRYEWLGGEVNSFLATCLASLVLLSFSKWLAMRLLGVTLPTPLTNCVTLAVVLQAPNIAIHWLVLSWGKGL